MIIFIILIFLPLLVRSIGGECVSSFNVGCTNAFSQFLSDSFWFSAVLMIISILTLMWFMISLIKEVSKKKYSSFLKGSIVAFLILIGLALILGFAFAISGEGSCSIVPFLGPNSFGGCFVLSFVLFLIGLIPAVIFGAIVGALVNNKGENQSGR